MSSELHRLDSLLEITSSKRIHLADYVAFGVPFFRGKEVIERAKGNAISTELFISSEKYRAIQSKFGSPEDGDILLTSVGTLGVAYFVDGIGDFYFKDGNVTWFRNYRDNVVPKFLYYWLTSPSTQKRLDEISIGSTQRALTISALKGLEIELPHVKMQRAIVEILDAISDRITLLRETNATLEVIAQTLFKSWFVDFDPVRAKAEGRQLKDMDATTAALFPDRFEESEQGLVPKGWSTTKLGNVCDYLSRGISPKYLEEGGVLVINQKCIRDFSIDFTKARRHDPLQRKIDGRKLDVGDVLVNSTGVGTLGRVAQVLALAETAIVDSHVTVVRAGTSLSWPFLGLWMMRQQPMIETMGEGSTGQTELSRSKLAELVITVPPASILDLFDGIVKPLKERISLNENRVQIITQLRDTLLPRLISGQLLLPDADQIASIRGGNMTGVAQRIAQ